jgi:diadenosine tetraphosphate (Ap4A) HIT family hydrolase
MNIEMVGNKVRQLHIHIIARYESDFAWPESALSAGSALEYTPTEVEEIRVRLLS